jgi:hypothetical protein
MEKVIILLEKNNFLKVISKKNRLREREVKKVLTK